MKTSDQPNPPPLPEYMIEINRRCDRGVEVMKDFSLDRIPAELPDWARRFADVLDEGFCGGVQLIRFQARGKQSFPEDASLSYKLLPVLLGRTDVQQALFRPEFVAPPRPLSEQPRVFQDRYELVGKLSSVAAAGGAHARTPAFTGEQLLKAAFNYSNFVAPGELPDDCFAWYSPEGWCPAVASQLHHHTFVFLRRRDPIRLTLLLLTDDD